MTKDQIKSLVTIFAVAILNTITYAQIPCPQKPAKINIGVNRLDKALTELSSQISCKISYDTKLVHSFQSHTLNGNLTPWDALIQLVKGTGLEVHAERNSLIISQADQKAIGIRATTLQASLGQAVKSKKIAQKVANQMYVELGKIRTSVVELAKKQGFISAAEKASYQRTFSKAEQLLLSNGNS
jgi:hypothetical protein